MMYKITDTGRGRLRYHVIADPDGPQERIVLRTSRVSTAENWVKAVGGELAPHPQKRRA